MKKFVEPAPETLPEHIRRKATAIADATGRIVGAPIDRLNPLTQAKIIMGLESVSAELNRVMELTNNYSEDVPE